MNFSNRFQDEKFTLKKTSSKTVWFLLGFVGAALLIGTLL